MNFNYYIPTKILFGAGKLNQLAEEKLLNPIKKHVLEGTVIAKENG
jgi:alcohol dehydrogenase YqhD (iron-dependent ADH family)